MTIFKIPGHAPDFKLDTLNLTISLFLLVMTYIGYSWYQQRFRPRVPGPPRLPILGNLLQQPSQLQFIQYTEWAKEYGPVFSLDLLGQHVVVLNTYKVAADFFDRGSNIYNDRPRMIMVDEILTGGVLLFSLRYGDVWRRLRRAVHEGFNARAGEEYRCIHNKTIALAILRIMDHPESWEHSVEWFATSSIFSVLYDWPPLDHENAVGKQVSGMTKRITNASSPGAHLVEFLPIMKFLPSFVAKWKREGLAWNELHSEIFEKFTAGVAERLAKGETPRGFAAGLLSAKDQLSKKELTWLPGVIALGGIETTSTAIVNCMIAMLHYPDVMRKAQAELDDVVGRERTPAFEDKSNLPYIQAIVRETLRWRPIGPLAVPHLATEDKWYAGHFIPKGTIVIGNVWAMNRDPSVHRDPDVYRPERFLDASGKVEVTPPDTHSLGHTTYGFGRRICPGMYFAEQELWIAIVTLLWTFELRPPLDEKGNAILPPINEWIDAGLVVRSPPFACRFIPRFAEARALLETCANVP